MQEAKTIGIIVVCIMGILVLILSLALITAYPIVGWVIIGIVGVGVVLVLVWGFYYLVNLIGSQQHQISVRKLAREEEIERQRRQKLIEHARMRREEVETERRFLLEQRRLELEEQKIKIAAYEAQAVQVRSGHALVMRGYDWTETRTVFEPRTTVKQVGDVELVREEDIPQIEAPRPRQALSALEMLEDGYLDMQSEDTKDDSIVLGTDEYGEVVRRTWKRIMSILILGLMGGGKTNTTIWIALQLILKGYRVALVDKHAKSDESTHARLKQFIGAYDVPVGDGPQAAMRVIRHVDRVFRDRMDRGVKPAYKLVFVIDEFTATMRALTDKTSNWHEVAVALANLLGDLNSEGRKYGVYVMAIGQATNASRTGGTEIRDLFHTRVIHGMRERQAQNLGLTDEKQAIRKLETGQVYIDIEGRDDPFFCQVPEITAEFRQAVARRIRPTRISRNLPRTDEFTSSSPEVQMPPVRRSTRDFEPAMNAVQTTVQTNRSELPEIAQRVLQLRQSGTGKGAIILEVWGAKKGATEAYKRAVEEYGQIVENLVEMGYLAQ